MACGNSLTSIEMAETTVKWRVCSQSHKVEAWNRINVSENPELKEKVKDGSLFVWECPHCGASNLIPGQTLYHDPDARLMVFLLPDGALPESQAAALEQQLSALSGSLEGYTLRRVGDIGSLIEKVNIFDAGLDDCVIEMCKYVSRMELAGKEGGKDISTAPFKFFRLSGPDNDIEFSYPSEGRMHGVMIGFNVYEDCAGILRRNPQVKPSEGFARIDSDWIARFFR